MPNITINGLQIDRVYKKEVLGITIDDKLNWCKQTEEQYKNISSYIELLRNAKDFVDFSAGPLRVERARSTDVFVHIFDSINAMSLKIPPFDSA
jgi:hypothetical protein